MQENTSRRLASPRYKIGGRPPLEKKRVRNKSIGVRVNQAEWEELQRKAEYLNMSPATLLRISTLQRRMPSAPVPTINRKSYAALIRLSVNINQLVRAVHMGKRDIPLFLFLELKKELAHVQAQLLGLQTSREPQEVLYDS
ncbi:MAG: mobilization protein [Desulfovibrionaceae bacterium]|nr:mobilization protein [Desulfovibrionaceae bacterium]